MTESYQKACKAVYYGVKVVLALLGFSIYVGFGIFAGWLGYFMNDPDPFLFLKKVENPTLWTYTYQGLIELTILLLICVIAVLILYGIGVGLNKAYEMYQDGKELAKK